MFTCKKSRTKRVFVSCLVLFFLLIIFSPADVFAKDYLVPQEQQSPTMIAPVDICESSLLCKMALEIDPNDWNPNGRIDPIDPIDNPNPEEIIDLEDPTHPYAPYETIIEHPEDDGESDPAQGGSPDDLIPLNDLEEEVVYVEDVYYLDTFPLPNTGSEIEPETDDSPLTGGRRDTLLWSSISIVSLLAIVFLRLSRVDRTSGK